MKKDRTQDGSAYPFWKQHRRYIECLCLGSLEGCEIKLERQESLGVSFQGIKFYSL